LGVSDCSVGQHISLPCADIPACRSVGACFYRPPLTSGFHWIEVLVGKAATGDQLLKRIEASVYDKIITLVSGPEAQGRRWGWGLGWGWGLPDCSVRLIEIKRTQILWNRLYQSIFIRREIEVSTKELLDERQRNQED
jgi:hypothetical protein